MGRASMESGENLMQNKMSEPLVYGESKTGDDIKGELTKEELFNSIKKKEFSREAEIFKALGHPIRLKIVYGLLKVGGCNVKNMQECLGLHQATVSQHLIHLKTRGIIRSYRQGLEMVYTVTDTWAKCIVDNIEKNKIEPSDLNLD
ncbi:MAG: metalloregulator ArsR/SmtB family transcription factor [Pseudomonadota bacterium]